MKRYLSLVFLSLFLSFIYSCQKEVSFETGQAATGSLQSTSGDCAPKTVAGIYKATQALTDSNYIDVTVNVTQTGTYTIGTDTANGYWFRGTGNFSSTGTASVRLKGFGTPSAAGTNNFNVRFDSSVCVVPVTVLPAGSSSGGTAAFSLQGSPGTCTGASISGTYTQGTALGAGNTVALQVNVTAAGTWSISTSTVSGFSFTGSGTFASTGPQTVTLNGTGNPTAAGPQTFSVTAGASSCTFVVTVTGGSASTAVFTLQGGPGACSSATPAGTYTQGTALGAANTVAVQVNVTTAGTWTASTNTVTGFSFAGSGTVAATGVQTIVLNGTGTPNTAGAMTFTITAGASTCTFSVTVGGTTATGVHFPLTPNSWWSYDDGTSPGDSLKRTNIGTATLGGNTYRDFEETDNAGAPNADYYFRKDASNNYYEYTFVDNYSVMTFDGSGIEGDILFLKEGLTTGQTWNSTEWTGTEGGAPKKLRYVFTCTDANASVTVNGITFTNVYKVTMKSQTSPGTSTFTDEGLVWEFNFAKDIGLVLFKATFGAINYQWPLKHYQVF